MRAALKCPNRGRSHLGEVLQVFSAERPLLTAGGEGRRYSALGKEETMVTIIIGTLVGVFILALIWYTFTHWGR